MPTPRFTLSPYKTGGTNRFTCPQCGRRKCFTPYVDTETDQFLDEHQCGRCDHESSCGYHLKPRDYFRLHPDRHASASGSSSYRSSSPYSHPYSPPQPPQPLPITYLPSDIVADTHSSRSQFVRWLATQFPDIDAVRRAYDSYLLGATPTGGVIFWQIDTLGRVRTGKVMHYHPDGHRVKDAEDFARLTHRPFTDHSPQPLYFYHKQLIRQHVIPEDAHIEQCLFGEHLLPTRPEAPVCLVESEKTAVVCSISHPQFLWLATGGCKQLSPRKLQPLRQRDLIIYPDSGELNLWSSIMQRTEGFNYRIVKALEQYPRNTDIADILLRG